MQVLTKKSLPLGGFAGLTEHRLVTDRSVFGARKSPNTFDGLGNFVYLADAQFNPKGQTGMHPHKEIDVISVMIDGNVSHEGSLEHGKGLAAGDVQAQRAGGEGFSHNEVNPDNVKNRMIQLWVLPEKSGQRAAYKKYSPKKSGTTHIYGGSSQQQDTFDSSTHIHIVNLTANKPVSFDKETLVYVTGGQATVTEDNNVFQSEDGDLIRSFHANFATQTNAQLIVISQA